MAVAIVTKLLNNNNTNKKNNKHIYKVPCMPTEGCRGAE